MTEFGAKIRRGAAWSFAGKFSTQMLNFVIGIVLARILVPEDFGLVATVGILTGIAGYFAGAGMGQALVRSEQADQIHYNVVFTMQLAISCIIYLLFVLVAKAFANFFEQPLYQSLLLVSGLNFFLRPFTNLPSSRLQREMRFAAVTVIGLVTLVVSSTLSIVMAWHGYGPWSLVISGLAGAVLNALLLNFHVGQRYALKWDPKIARALGGYGAKVAANSLIEHFRQKSLLLILSKLNGPADVGLYNRSMSLAGMPMEIVGAAPYQAVFRALAAEQENLDKSRYIYYRTITLTLTYTLPLYVLAWWLAEPGIRFIYGDKWLASAEPLAILALTGFFRCIANPSGAVVEARNRVSTEIILNVVAWALLVAGVLYGLQWGLVGVAWAAAAMTVFMAIGLATVAGAELQGSFRSLLRSVLPGLQLNLLMLAAIVLADALLLSRYVESSPGLYSLLVTLVGGTTYVLSFLFLPIASLRTEAAKWRDKLRRIAGLGG